MTSAMMMMMMNGRGGSRMSLDSSSGHHDMMTDNYTLCNLDSHTYLHISSYDRHGNREAGASEERSAVRPEGSLGAYHGYHGNSMVMRQPPIDYERFVGKSGNSYHYNNNNSNTTNNNSSNSSISNNDNDETRNVADSSSVVCSTKDEDNYRLAKDNKEEGFDKNNNNDNSDNNVVVRVIAPEDEPCDWRYKNYNNTNNNSELNGRHVDSKMNLYQQQQQQQVSYSYDDEQLASGARVQSAHFAHLHGNDSIQQSPNYYHGDREAPVGFFAGAFGPPQHHHHHFGSSERAAYQLPSSSEPSTCLTSNSNTPSTSTPMISFSDNSAFNVTTSTSSTTHIIDSNDKSNNKHGFTTSSPTPQNPGIDQQQQQQQQQQQRLPNNTPSSMHHLPTSDYSASSYYYPYHNSLPVPLLNPTYNATSNNNGNNTVQPMENSIFTSRYFTGGGPVSPISPAQFYTQYHPHTSTVDQSSSNLYPHQTHHSNHPHQLLYADRAFGGLSGVFGVEGARGIISSNIYAGFQPQAQGSLRNGLPSPPTFLMGGATLDGGGLLGPHFPHHHHLGLPQDHQLVSSTGGSTSSSSSSTTNASGLATYKWMTVKRGSPRTTSLH